MRKKWEKYQHHRKLQRDMRALYPEGVPKLVNGIPHQVTAEAVQKRAVGTFAGARRRQAAAKSIMSHMEKQKEKRDKKKNLYSVLLAHKQARKSGSGNALLRDIPPGIMREVAGFV